MGSVSHGKHGVTVSETAPIVMEAAGFTIIYSFSKLRVKKKRERKSVKEAYKHYEPKHTQPTLYCSQRAWEVGDITFLDSGKQGFWEV